MTRARVGPAWAFVLAGSVAIALHPAAAAAQRAPRVRLVEISPADAQIQVGQSQVFLANAYDAGNNPIGSATFAFISSNPRIATVDANGIATGVGPGVAIITARTGSGALAKSATASLTVTAGNAVVPQAAAAPPAPTPVVTPPPAVARPVPGRPTGPGYAAFDHQVQGSGPALGLRVVPRQATLVRGEYFALRYEALNASGELAERVPLLFEVDEAGRRILAVDSVGVVRAVGDTGSTRVRIVVPTNPNIQPRIAEVVVKGDSVAFSRAERWLTVGSVDTLGLVVPALGGRAFSAPPGHFQFESSDETKVRVNAILPVITAVAPGVARVSGVGSAFYQPAVTVHVLPPVVAFRVTPAESTITVAMRATVTVHASPLAADSSVVAEAKLDWTPPDTAIARFDTLTGALRGVRMGETRLVVSAPLSHDSVTRRVWQVRVLAGGLAVSRGRVGVGAGERTPVLVELLDDRRQPIGPATDLQWRAAPDSVARYADGHVLGLHPGRTRLTGRTAWDSTVAVDVFVAGPLLASARRGGRWDLYMLTADSAPRFFPVTADAAVEQEPAWSPDLTRIAYTSAPPDRPNNPELWVANADGSEPRRLTFDSASVGSPVFVRPSGERLVFQSSRGPNIQLYEVNRDGTGRRALGSSGFANSQPDVSPDGRKVLFVSLRQLPGGPRNYDVWEVNLDGTGERRLTMSPRPESAPRYAADGRSFYYLRDDGSSPPSKRIYRQSLADSTGATAQPVTPAGMFVQAFSVSADGTIFVVTKLEVVRGGLAEAAPQVALFDPSTNVATPLRVGPGEQLGPPVFRPATPTPPR